ncbi:MAG: hypothetical protein JHD16_14710 [Solirubrobacteraceae bacterium]|nr:hypothetical protein [Solirubrobacteraceae bacterium]
MSVVAPYLETETFPRGRRLLLVPVACLMLVGPYGALLGDGPGSLVAWVFTLITGGIGALLLGVGIAQPRRLFTADGSAKTVTISQTGRLPKLTLDRVERPFAAVTATSIEEVGTQREPGHGFRPVLTLTGGDRILLRRQADAEQAQNVIDHLVRLGLPGVSRAAVREAQFGAPPPTNWL